MCCVQSVPAGTGGHFPLTVLPQRCLSFLSQALSWTLFYLSLYSLLILSSQIQHRAISPLHMNTKQSRVCVCVCRGEGERERGQKQTVLSSTSSFLPPNMREWDCSCRAHMQPTAARSSQTRCCEKVFVSFFISWFLSNRQTLMCQTTKHTDWDALNKLFLLQTRVWKEEWAKIH